MENFSEKEQLARDLEQVGARVEEVRSREAGAMERPAPIESPEKKKEIVRTTVGEMAREEIQKGSDEASVPVPPAAGEENYLPDYMEGQNVDEQTEGLVEALLQIAVDKGILRAFRDSKKYPPFIQDAFHDALADKLVPEMERRGIL